MHLFLFFARAFWEARVGGGLYHNHEGGMGVFGSGPGRGAPIPRR